MIKGIIPALVTPFRKDGSIDYEEAKKLFGSQQIQKIRTKNLVL